MLCLVICYPEPEILFSDEVVREWRENENWKFAPFEKDYEEQTAGKTILLILPSHAKAKEAIKTASNRTVQKYFGVCNFLRIEDKLFLLTAEYRADQIFQRLT